MKNEKIKKILISAAVIAVILIALDYVIMPMVVSSEVISVPNVVNKHKDEAVRILEAANLNPVLQTPQFDEKTKKDFIFLQRPVSGSQVKEGRRVYLAVSGGNEKILMPNLFGKTAKDAQLTLENNGLKMGYIEQSESEEPQNTVIRQSIIANSNVTKGTVVNITVSLGPAEGMVRMPGIIGKSLKDAESILGAVSLKIGKIDYRVSPGLLPNTVMEQSPSEGSLVNTDGTVDLVVSTVKK